MEVTVLLCVRHLNPTVLETLNRPTLLITDALNALTTQVIVAFRSLLYEYSVIFTICGWF